MKKILSILISITLLLTSSQIVLADEAVEGLSEKLNAIILDRHFTEEQIAEMDRGYIENFNAGWDVKYEQDLWVGTTTKDTKEEEYEYQLARFRPIFEYGVRINLIQMQDYCVQYSNENKLKYIISDEYFWQVLSNASGKKFDMNGNYITSSTTGLGSKHFNISKETYAFWKDEETIKQILLDNNITKVDDIRIVVLSYGLQFMYIRNENDEYLIPALPNTISYKDSDIGRMDSRTLYRASEVINEAGEIFPKFTTPKPTYETEAQALQSEGLLNGNENGLDLLKPLTRIEATALLVRALGLEEESAQYTTSTFADIPSDNWGSPYAEIAKARGITNGVSETEFAPNAPVTSDQFATLVLRAAGQANIDYTQGTELLIEQGIITDEQSQTMDLFTRGDMAKIIYEARENGLL